MTASERAAAIVGGFLGAIVGVQIGEGIGGDGVWGWPLLILGLVGGAYIGYGVAALVRREYGFEDGFAVRLRPARAGWYPDPTGAFPERRWTGKVWSVEVKTAAGAIGVEPLHTNAPLPAPPARRIHPLLRIGVTAAVVVVVLFVLAFVVLIMVLSSSWKD